MAILQKKVIRAVKSGSGDTGRLVGQSLGRLRTLAGVSLEDMASRLALKHDRLIRIEREGDVDLAMLKRYVEALGAKLRIEAAFPSTPDIYSQFSQAFEANVPDDDQLVFPLFGDDLFPSQRDVVLSIKPHYTQRIMDGRKTVELRRRFPLSAPRGAIAYIYSTSPDRAIVGRAEIADVIKLPIADIWRCFGKSAVIKRADFQSYFDGLHEGFAIQFSKARPFSRPLPLSELRDRFGFEPPQSFLYATPVLRKALHDEFPDVSD